VVTLPWRDGSDRPLRNAIALIAEGTAELRFKYELPNYGVFDEKRLFVARRFAGAGDVSRCSHRRSDLRRHLASSRHRASDATRRRAVHRSQRIAVRSRQIPSAD
jgi:hypothetical protein